MSDFQYNRYKSIGTIDDVSDGYANAGFYISFYHLISQKELKFKAYISNYNETYNSDFAQEQVFGRADPIYAYRSTTRQISLAFKMPASSLGEAYEHLAKAQELIQFMYPAYTDSQNTLTIAQTPLVRLKVMNLLGNMDGSSLPNQDSSYQNIYDSYGPSNEGTKGLLGVLSNVTLLHNIDNDQVGVFEKSAGVILPKLIEVSLNFSPIHEHTVGWLNGGNNKTKGSPAFSEPAFPYGTGVATERTAAEDRSLAADELIEILVPDQTVGGSGELNQSQVDEALGTEDEMGFMYNSDYRATIA